MTEPCSTGIGGDMFILFWDAKAKQVKSMNGSGRAGAKCTLETIRNDLKVPEGQEGSIPLKSAHAVTVPGAAAGWVDTVERFGSGKLSMAQILEPAIKLGEKGFPVSELTSHSVSLDIFVEQQLLIMLSGRVPRICSGLPPPTLPRCSRRIPRPKTASALPNRVKS